MLTTWAQDRGLASSTFGTNSAASAQSLGAVQPAAAAALVRGDNYTPEKITTGGKVKVPPPVPQKPGKPGPGAGQYNKMGMDELWPGGWDEYSKLTLYIQLVVRVLIANLYLQIFCKVDTMEAL